MCDNFEVIFFADHFKVQAQQLLELLQIGVKARNLVFVEGIANFWIELKSTLIESLRREVEDSGESLQTLL